MSKADGKKAIFARIDGGVAEALSKTAARLGTTSTRYVEQAIVRCVAQDTDRVALANSEHEAEVERLSEAANELIQLAAGHRPQKKA